MARCSPQSQTQALLEEKREIARRLLAKGLTVAQIRTQLRCSATLVRHVRAEYVHECAER